MQALKNVILLSALSCVLNQFAHAETHIADKPENIFLPENAILDTSVIFAIGAREAQQELRGSYGWDTFQEGLVEGVYFRFDPDGYARFSPSARLDSNLFEVICRPRSLNCLARKGDLSIAVNSEGKLQLSMNGIEAGDQYFIADALTEFELPGNIWQPLDHRYENVLAIGGELVVRRGQNEIARVSLTGFSAVTSYLRWILAGQDYLSLPRNWPVPNSSSNHTNQSLTNSQNWRASETVATSATAPVITDAVQNEARAEQNEELASLRALVEQLATQNSVSSEEATPVSQDSSIPVPTIAEAPDPDIDLEARLSEILARLDNIEAQIQHIEKDTGSTSPLEIERVDSVEFEDDSKSEEAERQTTASPLIDLAEQVDFLTNEYGIEPRIALLLLKLKENDLTDISYDEVTLPNVEEILQDTAQNEAKLASEQANDETDASNNGKSNDEAFVLLTEYFRSVKDN